MHYALRIIHAVTLYNGIDIIEISRIAQAIERWGPRFLQRVFTPGELADCHVPSAGSGGNVASLAARWAAKEATAKALGVGLRGLGAGALLQEATPLQTPIGWHEVEVVRAPGSRPTLQLHGSAAALAVHLGIGEFALSLSHTREHAIASVVGMSGEGVMRKT